MPPELEELLRLDDEANDRFHHPAPGKQRYILQYLAKIKSSQLRIERALRIMDNLRRLPRGKESYQGLFANINEPL